MNRFIDQTGKTFKEIESDYKKYASNEAMRINNSITSLVYKTEKKITTQMDYMTKDLKNSVAEDMNTIKSDFKTLEKEKQSVVIELNDQK